MDEDPDELLTPAETAAMCGVRVTTINRWVHDGLLRAQQTPGGQRRYRRADVQARIDERSDPEREQMIADAVRLYAQDRPIRQVARVLGLSYHGVHRILKTRTTLRSRNGGARPTEHNPP